MRRDDINKDLYSNISISDEMKKSLIDDVKKGKRAADLRFRYSTAIMALAIVGVVGFGGFGVSAAYRSYKNRVEEMPVQEQEEYAEELEADNYDTTNESYTRQLTSEEHKRYLELEDEYYVDGRFPAESITFVETESDLEGDELAFVKDINKIHIPEGELTDEQLLQLIDHTAKYLYTIEQNAEAEAEEASATEAEGFGALTEEEEPQIAFDVSAADEESIKQQSVALVKELYGIDVDDSWNSDVYLCKLSEMDGYDESWDCYEVNFSESDAPNATFFQISIPINEGGVFSINAGGKDIFCYNEYSKDEAEAYFEEGKTAVIEYVNKHFGLGEPDSVEMCDFVNGLDEPIPSEEITYSLKYGEDEVVVSWIIDSKFVDSVYGRGLLDLK